MKPRDIACIGGLGLIWMAGAVNIIASFLGKMGVLSYFSIEKFVLGMILLLWVRYLEKKE